MTSVATDEETKAYFTSQNNFGISEANIHYFVQGYLPAINQQGKVLLEDKNTIGLSPNGNGGVYESLHSSGVLKNLNDIGVKHVQVEPMKSLSLPVDDYLSIDDGRWQHSRPIRRSCVSGIDGEQVLWSRIEVRKEA